MKLKPYKNVNSRNNGIDETRGIFAQLMQQIGTVTVQIKKTTSRRHHHTPIT